jgi:two-component system chemotaxis sensor kinase CheA
LRDQLLPLVSLRNLLGLDGDEDGRNRFILVTRVGGFTFGIVVDRVFDAEEIVVKPVAPILRGNPYYAGNTILGDGSVIMILDANGISGVAGQGQTRSTAEQAETASEHGEKTRSSLLLFRAGGNELKAVPLDSVARIEEIDAVSIEHVSGAPVVQYRGHLMPLLTIHAGHVWKSQGKQPLLVFDHKGKSLGIVVDQVVDIASDHVSIEIAPGHEGVLGSAIIAGKATDLVDIEHYLGRHISACFGQLQEIAA